MPFEGLDFADFWDESDYIVENYVSAPPSDELIKEVEDELGYKLPSSYIWLMKQHNGGLPKNDCFPCEYPTCWAPDHVAISGILGIGRDKKNSLCGEFGSKFWIDDGWEYPAIGVVLCDTPTGGHDLIFLDYRECGPQGEPSVVHVDQEDEYKITPLADDFESFIRGLVSSNVYDTSEQDRLDTIEMIRNASFSPMLTEGLTNCDNPETTGKWIRTICEKIVEEKGYFALHDDELSYLLYDIQFWLYSCSHEKFDKETYLSDYDAMIAFGGTREEKEELGGTLNTGGYGPSFVHAWLDKRLNEGSITSRWGNLRMSKKKLQAIIAQRDACVGNELSG